jgi:hypothetical protein
VICPVERCVTGSAGVDAGAGHVFVEFTGVGSFGSLLADDAKLFCRGNVSCRVQLMSWAIKERIPGVSTACHSSSDFWTG